MRLKISHRTEYRYDIPVPYALQRLRLVPRTGRTQTVHSWSLKVDGANEEARFVDHFENETRLVSIAGDATMIGIDAWGEVETFDTAGVFGEHKGFAPLWLFQYQTALTAPGDGIRELAASIGEGSELDRLHRLMNTIQNNVVYTIGATHAGTTAEEALGQGTGVCQDHAHIVAAAARLLGFPARYVSGYLMMNDTVDQAASHAWARVARCLVVRSVSRCAWPARRATGSPRWSTTRASTVTRLPARGTSCTWANRCPVVR